jgi:hypothetical protein
MNGRAIEARLHRLVDGVEAPATTTALRAIERRTRRLRRRRHVGVVAAAGVVVAVVASLAGRGGGTDVRMDPQGEDEGGMPAYTLELAGWQVAAAHEEHDIPASALGGDETAADESVQSFRRPGDPLGPSILVRHGPDVDAYGDGEQDVTVRGRPAEATTMGDDVALRWRPDGRTRVALSAHELTLDQALEFAEGLEPVDDDIALPPGPDDRFGLDATVTVAGLVEQELPPPPETIDRRYVVLTAPSGPGLVEITVDNEGRRAVEEGLAVDSPSQWEDVSVDGRPLPMRRVQVGGPTAQQAQLTWMVDDTNRVTVQIVAADESELDAVVAGLHRISDERWAALQDGAPRATTTSVFRFGDDGSTATTTGG